MATESVKRCDVTGKTKGTKTYRVLVDPIEVGATEMVVERSVDLCPAALERLAKAIERYTSPNKRREP